MTPLQPRFGVEIHGVDLSRVTATDGYPAIRRAFETHSVLLFRDQRLDAAAHLRLGPPRTLASICISARDVDGLEGVWP